MKKNLLLIAFIIVFTGIKAQTEPIEFPRELLTEQSISSMLKESRKSGVKEFEIQIQSDMLHKIMQRQKIGNYNEDGSVQRGATPPLQVNTSGCTNPGFENGSTSGWTFQSGTNYNSSTGTTYNLPCPTCITSSTGIVDQVVNSTSTATVNPSSNCTVNNTTPSTNGIDNYGGFSVLAPGGGNYSLLLNNTCAGYKMQQAQYTFVVGTANDVFIFNYAAVLQDGGHPPNQSPYFSVSTTDINTGLQPACAQYNAIATSGSLSGFSASTTSAGNSAGGVSYKAWTTVSLDLQASIGHTVTVKFTVSDCNQGGHFGYCYIDADCSNPNTAAGAVGLCGTTGGSLSLTAPPGYSTYQWYGPSPNNTTPIAGATSQTLTTTAAVNDTFIVKTTSAAGCVSTFNIVVKPSVINVTTSSASTCKGGSNGSVSAIAGGTGSFQYSWMSPTGPIGTNTTTTINNLPPGIYSVSITDNVAHCPQKDTTITILAINPTLQTANAQLCGTQTVLNGPAAFPATGYNWYDNANTLTPVTTQTYNVTNGSNNQHYTVTYLNSAHCEDSLQITLNQVNINFTAQQVNPCVGGNSGSLAFNASPNNSFTTYDWAITGGTTGSATNTIPPYNFPNLAAGTYTMVITAPGNTTCFYTDVLTLVASNTVIPVTTDPNHKVCTADVLVLNSGAPGTSSNSWTGTGLTYGANTTSTLTINTAFTNTVSGFYTYIDTIATSQGCKSIYIATITVKSFTAKITVVEPLHCYHDSTGKLKATVSGEKNGPIGTPDTYTFNWQPASSFTNSANPSTATGPTASSTKGGMLKAGSYTCVVTNGNCIETATITLIDGHKLPTDSFYAYYCPKDSLALLVADTGNTNYAWHYYGTAGSGYNGQDSIQIPVTDINKVYVTYKHNGCADTAKVIITVSTFNAFRPNDLVNIFSPNGDGRNDLFYPFYQANFNQSQINRQEQSYELKVYNRWGLLMYETTEYNKPWDGKTKGGSDAADGSYFFVVKYQSNCGTKADLIEKKGFVELLR